MTDAQLLSHASHPMSSSASWSLLNGSISDESAPLRTTPFPSSHHPASTDLNPTLDPALSVTPERTVTSRVPIRCPVPIVSEDDCEADHRATKVHFDHTVSIHHLSPEYVSNDGSPEDYRLSELNTDSLFSTELNTSVNEPISVIASDLRRLSPNSMSLLGELESSRCLQRTGSAGKNDSTRKKKRKSKSGLNVQVVTESGNTRAFPTNSADSGQDAALTTEAECALAKPEFNSTLKMSNEIARLQQQEFDLLAVTKEKINPKLKQQVFEKVLFTITSHFLESCHNIIICNSLTIVD